MSGSAVPAKGIIEVHKPLKCRPVYMCSAEFSQELNGTGVFLEQGEVINEVNESMKFPRS